MERGWRGVFLLSDTERTEQSGAQAAAGAPPQAGTPQPQQQPTPAAPAADERDGGGGGDEREERQQYSAEEVRAQRRENQQLRQRLRALEAAQREREEAELTEQQRLANRAERAETELASLQERHRQLMLRTAVVAEAQAQGFVDTDAAYRLLDAQEMELRDDGTPDPRSLRAALERLKKARPWLLNQEAAQAQAAQARQDLLRNSRGLPSTPAGSPAPQPTSEAEIEARLRASGQYARL